MMEKATWKKDVLRSNMCNWNEYYLVRYPKISVNYELAQDLKVIFGIQRSETLIDMINCELKYQKQALLTYQEKVDMLHLVGLGHEVELITETFYDEARTP